jgi:hypothetical protein
MSSQDRAHGICERASDEPTGALLDWAGGGGDGAGEIQTVEEVMSSGNNRLKQPIHIHRQRSMGVASYLARRKTVLNAKKKAAELRKLASRTGKTRGGILIPTRAEREKLAVTERLRKEYEANREA